MSTSVITVSTKMVTPQKTSNSFRPAVARRANRANTPIATQSQPASRKTDLSAALS